MLEGPFREGGNGMKTIRRVLQRLYRRRAWKKETAVYDREIARDEQTLKAIEIRSSDARSIDA